MKKGFTLVELLAVIVILAVIALITTPIVLSLIYETRKSAILSSAQLYIKGVEQAVTLSRLNDVKVKNGTYSIMEDGNVCIGKFNDNICDGDILKLEIKGDPPTKGTIKIKDSNVENIDIIIKDKKIWIAPFTGNLEYKLEPGIYDKNDKLLMSWEELVKQYNFENIIETGGLYEEYNTIGVATEIINSINGAYKLVIGNGVTKIGDEAFSYSDLKEIIIPNNVKSMGSYAFGYSSLKKIIIPSEISIIEEGAFMYCASLENVIIEDGVESIGSYAFMGATSLTSIIIPNRETSIQEDVFSGCTNLIEIYYKGDKSKEPWGAPNENVKVISDF